MPVPALLPLDGGMQLLTAASNQSRFATTQRDTATTSLSPKDEGCEGSSQNALTCISTSGGSQGRLFKSAEHVDSIQQVGRA